MTVTAVTVPVPPNSNLERAMYVWVPQVGGASDPMGTDAHMQSLLNFCSTNGVNTLFLDIWAYLGGGNWSAAHATTYQKFLSFAHQSGIKVLALVGNTDWGHNQQWVADNIIKPIRNVNLLGKANATTPGGCFDGVIYDVEYWTVANYTGSLEGVGLCDLMQATRKELNVPVGCYADNFLVLSSSTAQTWSYGGVTQIEGLQLAANADFVAVACYYDLAAYQINDLQPWFNYASQTGLDINKGLYCISLTDSGFGTQSYWTGAAGAKATMEVAHTSGSVAFTAAPNTNMAFLGQAIEDYASYSLMT